VDAVHQQQRLQNLSSPPRDPLRYVVCGLMVVSFPPKKWPFLSPAGSWELGAGSWEWCWCWAYPPLPP
jgi:hypothetical protein